MQTLVEMTEKKTKLTNEINTSTPPLALLSAVPSPINGKPTNPSSRTRHMAKVFHGQVRPVSGKALPCVRSGFGAQEN